MALQSLAGPSRASKSRPSQSRCKWNEVPTRRFTDGVTDTGTAHPRNTLETRHLRVEPMAGIEPNCRESGG
jgi:hypothetical protein